MCIVYPSLQSIYQFSFHVTFKGEFHVDFLNSWLISRVDLPSPCRQLDQWGWCTRWSCHEATGAPSAQHSRQCVWVKAWTGHSMAQTSPQLCQPLRQWMSPPAQVPVWCLSGSARSRGNTLIKMPKWTDQQFVRSFQKKYVHRYLGIPFQDTSWSLATMMTWRCCTKLSR